ncbi:MAG TPA: HEAT repeat domain-containing protein, partial [Tepidisphaeraceae bacterium]
MLAAAAVLASPLWVPAQENVPANDTAALSQALIDPNTKPEARDDVARRLLVRIDPAARTVLRDTLTNAQQPAAQLAAVRALAGFPTADDSLIPALFSLLDPSAPRPVFEAAAEALTAFKTNGEVLNRLLTVAREGRDERLRIAAIRAAGTFADKRVPATLIPLIDPAAQPPNIIRAADAALSSLTGTTPGSMSLEQWRRWWEGQSGKSDTQFQADLMAARGLQLDTARTTLTELEGEVARLLSKQYNDAPRDQRPEVLLQLLRSSNGTVRANGCRLAAEAALLGEAQPQSIREQLRLLVGDPVPQVRRGAAGALAVINDSEALTPLLTQLNQEPDSTVRAAIAGALRPIGDVRAVPALLTLLNDPRIDTAQAAATALSEEQLGNRIRQTNPDLAEQAADTIWKTLQKRTSPVNNTDLRTDLVRGMTSLRSRAHAPQLTQLLGRGAEQPKVLRSLLTAVGALRNAELAGAVAAYTDYADDSGVRLAAVRALGQVADT